MVIAVVDASGLQLPPPTDWTAFERVVRRLFSRVYACPLAEMEGRPGQHQQGIDIIGRSATSARRRFGIQCKLKDDLGSNPTLRRKTLEAEVAQAGEIDPPLDEFLVVTTAANDTDLSRHARRLTAARDNDLHPLEIKVIGWSQVRQMIGEHRDILDWYLGIDGVPALAEQNALQHREMMAANAAHFAELKEMLDQRIASTERQAPVVPPSLDLEDPRLTRAIDRIKAKLEEDDIRGALADLEALRADEWEDAGPTQRFRILSNLGAAYWRLGEYLEAETLFRDAAKIKPDDHGALANLAASAASAGDFNESLRAARRLIELDPNSTASLLPLIQAQERIDPPDDPMSLVPAALRDSEEAILGVAQVLRNRDDPDWLTLSGRGAQLHPDSDYLARMHADATLHRIATADGAHVGATGQNIPSHQEVTAAAVTLEQIWRKNLGCNPTRPDVPIAYNLANAFRALNRNWDALRILEEAERFIPEEGQIAHLHAMLLAGLDREDEARERLRLHVDDPASRILLAQLLTASPTEVRKLLDGAEMPAASREAMWRDVLVIEARARLEPDYDPFTDLERVAGEFPTNLVPLLALAKRADTPEARRSIADRVLPAIGPDTPFADILQTASWLREAGMHDRVVALLDQRTSRQEDSLPLRWLFEAWFQIDDRRALVDALDALPSHVAALTRFIYLRERVAARIGDMPEALAAVERLIEAEPESLPARLDWVQIVHRLQLIEQLDAWLATDVERIAGPPELQADLALLMANRGLYDRARSFAYRLARQHPANRHVVQRFVFITLNPEPDGGSGLGLSRIGQDAVFVVEEEGNAPRTYRIEGERDLPRESIDLADEAPIAKASSGLREKDGFELPAAYVGLPPRRFRITSVLHKHVHLFRQLMDEFSDRFDGPQPIYKTTVNPEEGAAALDRLIGPLLEAQATARDLNADYIQDARPLRIMAAVHGRSVIDTYDLLTADADTGFLCSVGGDEFHQELLALQHNDRRGCIVDTITLEIIRRYDLLETVHAIAGPIIISQGTVDDFIERADKATLLTGRMKGHLGQRDGRVVAELVHPAQIETAIEVRRDALGWVSANTRIHPAVGPAGFARRLAAMLVPQLQGQFCDDMLIAADTDLLLLSDDLGYRRLAHAVGINRRAGLLALLRLAQGWDELDRGGIVRTLAAFGRARHRFIAVAATELDAALALDGREIGPTMRGLCALLGGALVNLAVQWGEVSQFLARVWRDEGLTSHRLAIANLVADNLLSAAPEARSELSARLFRDPDEALAAFDRVVTAAIAEQREKRM